ncbi:MAG: type II secretion system F family protein [Patescibacteria group bacterium]
MLFHYTAADSHGKVYQADVEASSLDEVLGLIAKQDLKPISVKPLKEVVVVKDKFAGLIGGGKITLQDKIFLMKYLSLMLRVGTDLFKAIDILIQDFTKPAIRNFLLEVRGNLEKGNPFYTSFQNHPEIFSGIVVNLIKAAETSGNLEQTLMEISDSYAKEADLKGKVRSALIYPVLLLTVSFAIVVLLVTFVLPRISVVFEGSGAEMPFYTRIIVSFGKFVNQHSLLVLPLLFGSLIGLGVFLFKTGRGKQISNNLLRKTPLVKDIFMKLAIQRFSATLGSLLKAGILFVTALEITAEAVGEENMRRALLRIAKEEISRGVPIGEAFKKEQIFPQVVINLIAIGEKSGHVEEILGTLAEFYEKEIDESLKTFVSFLEPALLIFIGGIVALIAFSVIIPIYQLVSQYS